MEKEGGDSPAGHWEKQPGTLSFLSLALFLMFYGFCGSK